MHRWKIWLFAPIFPNSRDEVLALVIIHASNPN